ncbi:MAG TPA: hypothetical protein VNA88_19600 [Candidatus Kapabacteria bacterium]|jgi:hypothetical protein|nr:hypothetical protein [Candidatus Kapabacteria bacterium]
MKPNTMTVKRARVAAGVLTWMIVVAATARAGEPIPVEVTPVSQIQIGAIAPGEEREITYDMPEAAQFLITAKAHRWVTITVAIDDLDAQSPAVSDLQSNSLTLMTTGANCAYSVDDGQTWTPFESGELVEVVRMPLSSTPAAQIGRILLRIGGSVLASPSQQRGAYLGGVVVTAEYTGANDPGPGQSPAPQPGDADDDEYFTIPDVQSRD